MSRLEYSRLCRLIYESLHPFTVKSTVLITKEEEKLLLITLSQVLKKIKLLIAEINSDSDNSDHVLDISRCHSSASPCILEITNQLVFLLAVKSQYGQHLAANVLVSVSEFVVASRSYWEEFMQSLCFYFEIIFCKVVSPSSDPPIGYLGCDSTELSLDLQRVLDNASWQLVGAIVLVLRSILKQLKREDDVEILDVYFQVLSSCLEVIPWDACNRILVDDDIDTMRVSWFEFCGYLVQLFCSLADCEEENPAVREVFNVFPKTLILFLGKQGETCKSQYIRHKILVLMIRLSSLINLDCDTTISWLHLIKEHFQDLLSESVSEPKVDQDDCLRDSPFNGTSHRHLQRRVIFLYLKCAFSLIGSKEKSKKQCSCGGDMKNSCSKKGFTAVYEWLKKHLPANIFDNHELYNDCSNDFSKSFIQLYIHEDDMLFKILLQLTYTQLITEEWTSQVVEKDTLILLSDIFDPVRLFHLFLSELHYDHQVLLDYLISKDTGASCAEYLLRSLRIICDKWDSFLDFPIRTEVGRQSFPKRRKFEDDKGGERAFHKACDCLLLLKQSVESLHQKDLFPYNPQVLLRRHVFFLYQTILCASLNWQSIVAFMICCFDCSLTRFQELCLDRV